ANLFRDPLLMATETLDAVHDFTAFAIEPSEQASEQGHPFVLALVRAPNDEISNDLLRIFNQNAPRCQPRDQFLDTPVIFPSLLGTIESRAVPHCSNRDLRHLG